MPDPTNRDSLTKDLLTRYDTQREGGAFDVKDVIGQPNTSPTTGRVTDAKSANAQQFQNPNGFEIKVPLMISRYIMVQGGAGVSRYAKGLDTRKYSHFQPVAGQ